MKIQVKEKEIELKYTMRSLMIYEDITGKSFNPSTLKDIMIYFYSTLLASDRDTDVSFDEFVDYVDEHNEVISEFTEWITQKATIDNFISKPNSDGNGEVEDKKK